MDTTGWVKLHSLIMDYYTLHILHAIRIGKIPRIKKIWHSTLLYIHVIIIIIILWYHIQFSPSYTVMLLTKQKKWPSGQHQVFPTAGSWEEPVVSRSWKLMVKIPQVKISVGHGSTRITALAEENQPAQQHPRYTKIIYSKSQVIQAVQSAVCNKKLILWVSRSGLASMWLTTTSW